MTDFKIEDYARDLIATEKIDDTHYMIAKLHPDIQAQLDRIEEMLELIWKQELQGF